MADCGGTEEVAGAEELARAEELAGVEEVPALRAAQAHRLMVFSSASLLQGQLARGMPPELAEWFPGLKTDAQRALQFVRSTPGITCALVGMSHLEHVEENLATAAVAPLDVNEFRRLFAKSSSA